LARERTPARDDVARREGGVGSRGSADAQVRLTGTLPGAEAFQKEFPGADLLSSLLARSLERLGSEVDAAITTVWRRHGLSHAAGNALAVIEGAERAMTAGEIGAAMHITSGSITSLVDTLERRGLVERSAHVDDRRKVLVSITDQGRDLLDVALPAIQLLVVRLMGGLLQAERSQLRDLLLRAHESITSADLSDVPPGRRNHRRP
jgi:DNA-binding MarR family transcriptional regulator